MLLYSIKFLLYISLTVYSVNVSAEIKIPKKPQPLRFVNDFTNVLSFAEKNMLEAKLLKYYDTTSTQVVTVIINSTEGYGLSDYSTELGRQWGIGQRDKNNGVVILWARSDKKVFIGTGYGMEGVLPDVICKRIVEERIIPLFKKGMFYQGLVYGIEGISFAAKGEYTAVSRLQEKKSQQKEKLSPFAVLIIIALFLLAMFTRRGRILLLWLLPLLISSRGSRIISSRGGGRGVRFGGGSFGGGGAGGSY